MIKAKDKNGKEINICRLHFDLETKEDYAIIDWDDNLYLKARKDYTLELGALPTEK